MDVLSTNLATGLNRRFQNTAIWFSE